MAQLTVAPLARLWGHRAERLIPPVQNHIEGKLARIEAFCSRGQYALEKALEVPVCGIAAQHAHVAAFRKLNEGSIVRERGHCIEHLLERGARAVPVCNIGAHGTRDYECGEPYDLPHHMYSSVLLLYSEA